ncbi:MAG: sugar transferase [Adhaeribacter sp.]
MLRRTYHSSRFPSADLLFQLVPAWQQGAKRVMDVLVASLGLTLFTPLLLLLALLVKATSPGPVLYSQVRTGRGGRPFTIYKFRSMVTGAEDQGPALSFPLDPRVTPWGRWMRRLHLDELPQLYNVLCGHMSLVGPRPERPYFIDRILEQAPQYRHLLQVRPGITSLGMVKFGYARNEGEMVQRMRYDLLYLEKMSLLMDLRVLLYTFKAICEGRGH